jgi:hypothetical protein
VRSTPLLDAPPKLGPISFPAGYDPEEIVAPLRDPRWRETDRAGRPVWTEEGAAYRRRMTSQSPVHFALTYLSPYLTDQTTGRISFAGIHMDLAATIASAAIPGPHRDGFVGSREVGKSTWTAAPIGPTFVLAHGYRRFFHLFSLTDQQAAGKLATLVGLLYGRGARGHACAPLLLADFPELRPVKGAGGPGRHVLEGGQVLAARGMGGETLGENVEGLRPDVIAIDDPQPKEARNTPEVVAKAKSAIRTAILPMGGRAAVWLTGTVTMPGDLMDDVVLAALGKPGRGPDRGAWLGAERIRCHYHPVDWPDRFDPAELAALRAADLHTYALTYEPHLLGTVAAGRRFTRDLWRRDLRFPTVRRIISVDHATEQGPASDMTAIAVLGVDAAGQATPGRGRVCVEHVELGRYDIPALRERLFTICESFPRVKPDVVLWERNQGGRMLAHQLLPLPACCTTRTPDDAPGLWTWRAEARKAARIEAMHAQAARAALWLGDAPDGRLGAFEGQAEAWTPRATRDDALDAVGAGERYLRTGDPTM